MELVIRESVVVVVVRARETVKQEEKIDVNLWYFSVSSFFGGSPLLSFGTVRFRYQSRNDCGCPRRMSCGLANDVDHELHGSVS